MTVVMLDLSCLCQYVLINV